MTKYEIKSDYNEQQVLTDFTTMLTLLNSNLRDNQYVISSVDEQETGADAEIPNYGVPLYLQFKVSHGLKSADEIEPSSRKNRSKKEDIREFRRDNNLSDTPTLYFQLRRQAKTASDLQHNILRRISHQKNCYAFYVAPLSLKRIDHLAGIINPYFPQPFSSSYFENIHTLYHTLHHPHTRYSMPLFDQHISIDPHAQVDDHNHYYAYSQQGDQLSWHSPEIPENAGLPFGRRIESIIELYREKGFPNIKEVLETMPLILSPESEPVAYFDDFLKYTSILRKQHGIATFILGENKDRD